MIVCSTATFDEFDEPLKRSKFEKYLALEQRLAAIKEFRIKAFLKKVNISLSACRDPKDHKFLELAVAANAACIITGENDLLILHPFGNIPILIPVDSIDKF